MLEMHVPVTHAFVRDVCYGMWAVWLDSLVCFRRPAVLIDSGLVTNASRVQRTHLIKIHFLTVTVIYKPLQIRLYKRPRVISWKECE